MNRCLLFKKCLIISPQKISSRIYASTSKNIHQMINTVEYD